MEFGASSEDIGAHLPRASDAVGGDARKLRCARRRTLCILVAERILG